MHLHLTHKNALRLLLLLMFLTSLMFACPHRVGAVGAKVRPAGVADGFYPANPQELTGGSLIGG